MGEFWASLKDHAAVRFGVLPADMAKLAHGQVYLATPYTRRAAPRGTFNMDAAEDAAREAAMVVRCLALDGVSAVSPIALAQAVIRDTREWRGAHAAARLALDAEFWTRWCAPILQASTSVYVAAIPGWKESDGIRHEVREFLDRQRPVYVGGWA